MISLPLLLMGMVNHITHRISSFYGGAEGYNGEGFNFILSMGGILCSMFGSPAGSLVSATWVLVFVILWYLVFRLAFSPPLLLPPGALSGSRNGGVICSRPI